MKKVLQNLGLRSMMMGLFLLGAFLFSANTAAAQTSFNQTQTSTAKGLNWVTESEAVTILMANVDQYAQELDNMVPGSQAYNNALYHLSYYKFVAGGIDAGSIVPAAVLNGLQLGNIETNAKDDASPLTPAILNQLYADIVTLLTI